jgi:hypothetical protein
MAAVKRAATVKETISVPTWWVKNIYGFEDLKPINIANKNYIFGVWRHIWRGDRVV